MNGLITLYSVYALYTACFIVKMKALYFHIGVHFPHYGIMSFYVRNYIYYTYLNYKTRVYFIQCSQKYSENKESSILILYLIYLAVIILIVGRDGHGPNVLYHSSVFELLFFVNDQIIIFKLRYCVINYIFF